MMWPKSPTSQHTLFVPRLKELPKEKSWLMLEFMEHRIKFMMIEILLNEIIATPIDRSMDLDA